MNEFEKQVFNSLSEEEQEKIAGGETINPDGDLTEKQCGKLKNAAQHIKGSRYWGPVAYGAIQPNSVNINTLDPAAIRKYLEESEGYRAYLEWKKKQDAAEATPTTEPDTTNP